MVTTTGFATTVSNYYGNSGSNKFLSLTNKKSNLQLDVSHINSMGSQDIIYDAFRIIDSQTLPQVIQNEIITVNFIKSLQMSKKWTKIKNYKLSIFLTFINFM